MLENTTIKPSQKTIDPKGSLIGIICLLLILLIPVFSGSYILSTVTSGMGVILIFQFSIHRSVFRTGWIFWLALIEDMLSGFCLGINPLSILLAWKTINFLENRLFIRDNNSLILNIIRFAEFNILVQLLRWLLLWLVQQQLRPLIIPQLSVWLLGYCGSIVFYSIIFFPLEWVYNKLYQH